MKKRQKQKATSNLSKIEESESETSESDIYSSADNTGSKSNPVGGSNVRLKEKSEQIRAMKKKDNTESADDMPKNTLTQPAPKKKSSMLLRIISSVCILAFMSLCYCMGHIYYSLFLLSCSFKCYQELANIKRNPVKDAKNKMTTLIEFYIPILWCFYMTPKTFVRRIMVEQDGIYDFKKNSPFFHDVLFIHHSFISGLLLLIGLVVFTISLEKGQYRYQFKRLGWMIFCAIISMSAGFFLSFYVYKGYFWLLITNGAVIINDTMAYFFGKSFGKTPLIKLSPSKTMEGFVGGGISTILFAIFISDYISQYQQIVCPQNEITVVPFIQLYCERPLIYEKKYFDLPLHLGQIYLSPAQIHAGVIALFATLIAPFGGFLASGLKRSMKLKDFSDSIPGHGGFADRFDCHIVITFFVYIYLTQVVYKSGYGIERIFDYIERMDEHEKYQIYLKMHDMYSNMKVNMTV